MLTIVQKFHLSPHPIHDLLFFLFKNSTVSTLHIYRIYFFRMKKVNHVLNEIRMTFFVFWANSNKIY